MIGCFLRFCPGRLRKSKTGGTRASSRRCAEVVLPYLFALERTPLTGDEAPAAEVVNESSITLHELPSPPPPMQVLLGAQRLALPDLVFRTASGFLGAPTEDPLAEYPLLLTAACVPVRRKAREIYLAPEISLSRRAQGDTVCAPYSKGWRQRPWSSYTRSLGAQGVMAAKGLDDAAAEGGRQELPRPRQARWRLPNQ